MDRKAELMKIIENDPLLKPVVDEIVNLEQRLIELRKDNFKKYKPGDKSVWKIDKDKLKSYKELSQVLDSKYRLIMRNTNDDNEGDSPLREWVKSRNAD